MRTTLIVALVILGIGAFAQSPTYNWAETIKLEKADLLPDRTIFASSDDALFSYVRKGNDMQTQILTFYKHNKTTFEQEFKTSIHPTIGVMGDNFTTDDWLYSTATNNIYVLGNYWNKEEAKITTRVYTITGSGLYKKDEFISLLDYPAAKWLKSGDLDFAISPDGTKLAVKAEMPRVKKSNEKLILAVYEVATWEELYRKDIQLDMEDKAFKYNTIYVNNAGDIFMHKKMKVKGTNFQNITYSLSAKDQSWNKKAIDIGENQVGDFEVKTANNTFVMVGVTYKNGNYATATNGFVHLTASGGNINASHTVYPEKLCLDYISQTKYEKGSTTISNLRFKGLEVSENGDGWLFLERMAESSKMVEGDPSKSRITREYKDAVILKLSANGEPQWHRSIKRQQRVSGIGRGLSKEIDDYARYSYMVHNNKAYVIWNMVNPPNGTAWKTKDNVLVNVKEAFGNMASYAVFYTTFDENGYSPFEERVYSSKPMVNMFKSGFSQAMYINPETTFADNGKFYINAELYSGIRYRMGSVSFE